MRTLEQSILYPLTGREDIISAPYPYMEFAELLTTMQSLREYAPIAVINFNDDLCLDYALGLKSVPIDYGLGIGPKSRARAFPHYRSNSPGRFAT